VLTYCRLREFRGQTLYAVPSMFLDELPESVAAEDLSSSGAAGPKAMNVWRGGAVTASRGWYETGGFAAAATAAAEAAVAAPSGSFAEGVLVQHHVYGIGRITAVSGHGVMRKVKIRFAQGGERTFIAEKAKLTVVEKDE
jgi:DNA helicase-2/ATP-dependent DNA helicase PcrA